jgi:hypothetical protein
MHRQCVCSLQCNGIKINLNSLPHLKVCPATRRADCGRTCHQRALACVRRRVAGVASGGMEASKHPTPATHELYVVARNGGVTTTKRPAIATAARERGPWAGRTRSELAMATTMVGEGLERGSCFCMSSVAKGGCVRCPARCINGPNLMNDGSVYTNRSIWVAPLKHVFRVRQYARTNSDGLGQHGWPRWRCPYVIRDSFYLLWGIIGWVTVVPPR